MGKTLPEKLVEKYQADYSHKIIIPKKKQFHFPIFAEQPSLFQEDVFYSQQIPDGAIRGIIGLYGELLWNAIIGGRLQENYKYDKNGSPPSPESELCRPDISVSDTSFIESKMVSCAHELKLPSDQIQRYEWLQLDPVHNRRIQIKFAISRHNIRDLESRIKRINQEERIELFANSICYSIVLPFSIIHYLYHSPRGEFVNKKWNPSNEAGINSARVWNSAQRISSRALNEMFANPEETLKKIGIQLKDYEIDKQTFQGDVRVKTHSWHQIKPFPVLFIDEKNPEAFLEQFRKEHQQEHEDYLRALEQERIDAEKQLAEFSLKHEEEIPF